MPVSSTPVHLQHGRAHACRAWWLLAYEAMAAYAVSDYLLVGAAPQPDT